MLNTVWYKCAGTVLLVTIDKRLLKAETNLFLSF